MYRYRNKNRFDRTIRYTENIIPTISTFTKGKQRILVKNIDKKGYIVTKEINNVISTTGSN